MELFTNHKSNNLWNNTLVQVILSGILLLYTTSTNSMVKKISYRIWKKIHMLIYIAAPLSALHFFLLTKANKIEPIIYLSIIFLLLLWRL